eukprot:4151901-Pyramimonas_sp.AAC.1
MYPGHSQCRAHKKDVEVMLDCLKKGDDDGKKKHAELVKMRDEAPSEPPSPFSEAVIEFGNQFPSKGQGRKRGHTTPDVMQVVNRHSNQTKVAQGTKLVKMHKAQWLKHAKDVLVISEQAAKQQWEETAKACPDSMKDQRGPAEAPLRLPMPAEDYITGEQAVVQENAVEMRNKARRVSNEGDVADAQKKLSENHASFGNEMFNMVGGSALMAIGSVGGTSLGARGEGVFGAGAGAGINIFQAQLDAAKARGDEGSSASKKGSPAKPVEIEIIQAKLTDKLQDYDGRNSGLMNLLRQSDVCVVWGGNVGFHGLHGSRGPRGPGRRRGDGEVRGVDGDRRKWEGGGE